MPLQDHFHPPLSLRRHWHAFHNSWATYLAADINRQLPKEYFAEANVQFGIEIDVATFEEADHGPCAGCAAHEGWFPPAPVQTIPLTTTTDIVEVKIFHTEGGPVLAGAVELISPANKDRPDHREAFVSKCAAYLQEGVGLVIADVVTDRTAKLHQELLRRVSTAPIAEEKAKLYAAAYRPVKQDSQTNLLIWLEELTVGQPLPTMPLWLRGAFCVRVNLEASYERTCQEQRVPRNGE